MTVLWADTGSLSPDPDPLSVPLHQGPLEAAADLGVAGSADPHFADENPKSPRS